VPASGDVIVVSAVCVSGDPSRRGSGICACGFLLAQFDLGSLRRRSRTLVMIGARGGLTAAYLEVPSLGLSRRRSRVEAASAGTGRLFGSLRGAVAGTGRRFRIVQVDVQAE
jgi:hypothetical protein